MPLSETEVCVKLGQMGMSLSGTCGCVLSQKQWACL